MPVVIPVVAYPGLAVHTIAATFAQPLGAVATPPWLLELLRVGAPGAAVRTNEQVRAAVRDVLRVHGYRPTGRGKPSSEYLVAAVGDGKLGTINAAVDAGNVVSLHSGLPISVVDRDRLRGAPHVAVPPAGSAYVFNRSGQTIDVAGLVSLFDDEGPCANAVKDAQRTKTSPDTLRVLAIVWGVVLPRGAEGAGDGGGGGGGDGGGAHAARTARWLGEVFERLGAVVGEV